MVEGRKLVLKVDCLELVDVNEHVLMSTMRLDVMVFGRSKGNEPQRTLDSIENVFEES